MSLNQNFVDDKFVEEISTKYEKETQTLTESYELITKPFKALKFIDFLNDPEFISAIRGDVKKIELDRKNNDLYSLWQSGDLQNYPKLISIRKFIEVLKNEVAPLLEKIVKVKFNKTLSITASIYKHGDMLLCHDDKCDDRCVAFVYYLTGGTNEMGGAFEMFDHSNKNGQPTCVVKSIPPEKNSFLIFEVGNYTYHQVSEVRSQNFERLSINGWFHSDRKLNFLKYKEPFPNIIHQKKGLDFSFLDEYINVTYLTPSVIVDAQKEFEINSFILLKNYFVNSFFKKCLNNLKNLPITWKEKGPPNRRKYDVLDMKKITGNLDILINLLRSPSFFAYLKNITGLDIIASSDLDTNPSKMTLEVQRWTSGTT
ncbi:prolyl 3-hydroxylase sudestada1 isoform X2 [Cimex lectularius]|uniref:uS12 prolyl 3-hydroxylase n=1 Tax=Cimex lectularius TaxID=79782 RepID=A0A8I6RXW3_CIMLE|nr:prolyl 3-hydroxylase sudestada1 isoform X2 [Cimex lectularius]